MVDLVYVKKRKRRRIIEIVTAVGAVVVSVFVIIAFLGNNIGTFTVNLKTNSVELAMSLTSDFKDQTTYLYVGDLKPFDTVCYWDFENGVFDYSQIDNEGTTYEKFAYRDEDGSIRALPFFKYTFFLGNTGKTTARYTMKINILDNQPDTTTRKTLDEICRLVVLEDGIRTDNTVYALKSTVGTHHEPGHYSAEDMTDREYVCGDPDKPNKNLYAGLCTSFEKESMMTISRENFQGGEIRRYTVLFWLEGDDAECTGSAPKDAKLKIGVEIQAYEN